MRALLYRDWVLIKKTKVMYIGLIYLILMIPNKDNNFLMNYSSNFLFIFIVYLFFSYLTAYDYKYNGLAFSAAFPVSKRDIVTSRYVFIGLTFGIYIVLLNGTKVIINSIQGNNNVFDYGQFGLYIIIFSIFFGIISPLYYKLGYQKMRWAMFIGMFTSVIIISVIEEVDININTPIFLFLSLIVAGVLYWYSARISCRIIKKKDL